MKDFIQSYGATVLKLVLGVILVFQVFLLKHNLSVRSCLVALETSGGGL